MRLFLKTAGGLILVGLLAAAIWLRTPNGPKVDEATIKAAAKAYDARIIRDNWGVAHIFGKTDPDTSFGLGYSHAEDDWETIQVSVISSRGMSGQYNGKSGAATDYLLDLFKVREAVDEKIDTDLSPQTRAMATAYADGLNLWASENKDRVLPSILPVTDKDIIAGFTWNTPFFYRMDGYIQDLFSAEGKPAVSPWRQETKLNLPEAVRGSNAFAVAPKRSTDGHTRLIVNSHQPFVGPYAWFEAHVVSEEGLNLAGAGFPGTPILTQGVTPHHGWAQTVNRPDLVDIYELEVNDTKKPTQYKFDGTWKDFERSKSKFRVKLWGPFSLPITRDVLWSEHGPVLDAPSGFYAIKFAGLQEVGAMEQWYMMGKAQSLEDWKAAIALNTVLSFNITYADKNGNISEIYNAKMPKRIEGPDWSGVLPGDKPELIWNEYRPVSDLPQHYNPESGWLFSANSTPFRITDPAFDNKREDYSVTMGIEPRMTNRAMMALALIPADESISGEELLSYRANGQYHPDSPIRKRLEEIFAKADTANADLAEPIALLKSWDGETNLENRATALAVLTAMKVGGYEIIEDKMDVMQALEETVDELMMVYGRIDPTWGEVNRLRRGDVDLPLTGGPDTLRAIYGLREKFVENKGLTGVAGDTHIMYADWDENGVLSLESIHQFGAATLDETSPHYADQAPLFARGEYKAMPMTLDEVLPLAERDYTPGQ
ncbi:MAG: penicillin acylase family protein [Alphaproteobacteria bacterium]